MLNWYKNLYIGDTIKKNYKKTRIKIETGTGFTGAYLITLAVNPQNQLEILSADLLRQKFIRKTCPMIIGICRDHEEAVEIVCELAKKVYKETGSLKIRDYITERM